MLHFKYHSTNCFFLRSSTTQRLLAVDAGWPGTLYEYARMMKTIGCSLEDIAGAVVTHFHMDHAGLISEFMDRGIRCFAFENQLQAVEQMERTIRKNDKSYRRIQQEKLERIRTDESRELFASLGIRGQVIITDYHSPDSVTFITEEGEALVGDLPPQGHAMPGDTKFLETWELVARMGGRMIYPSHAEFFQLEDKS
jgi:ribonuclease/clavin/mitogillin